MKKEPQQDIFLRYLTCASHTFRRLFPRPARWLLAAVLFSAIAYWFWSPLWNDPSHEFRGGHWVQDLRRGGSRISGAESIVLGIAVTLFAPWAWIQVVRTTCSAIRNRKRR